MSEQISVNFTATAKEFIEAARQARIPEELITEVIRKLHRNIMPHTSITSFNLSPPIINALRRRNIDTEEELREYISLYGVESLRKIRNIGERRYEQLKSVFEWIADYE